MTPRQARARVAALSANRCFGPPQERRPRHTEGAATAGLGPPRHHRKYRCARLHPRRAPRARPGRDPERLPRLRACRPHGDARGHRPRGQLLRLRGSRFRHRPTPRRRRRSRARRLIARDAAAPRPIMLEERSRTLATTARAPGEYAGVSSHTDRTLARNDEQERRSSCSFSTAPGDGGRGRRRQPGVRALPCVSRT
jgi:hypothetical protein